jgi:large subunit ribosomal protein L23
MEPYEVILHPLVTEAASLLMENENKLVFIVNRKSSKKDIRKSVEAIYDVVVDQVNTLITSKGEKKAFVKLNAQYRAVDLAIKLGVL